MTRVWFEGKLIEWDEEPDMPSEEERLAEQDRTFMDSEYWRMMT